MSEMKELMAGIGGEELWIFSGFIADSTEAETIKFVGIFIESFVHVETRNVCSDEFTGVNGYSISESKIFHYLSAGSN